VDVVVRVAGDAQRPEATVELVVATYVEPGIWREVLGVDHGIVRKLGRRRGAGGCRLSRRHRAATCRGSRRSCP